MQTTGLRGLSEMVRYEGVQRYAENRTEFSNAWCEEVRGLARFYPLNEDQERFLEIQRELYEMIDRKAEKLFPEPEESD